MRRDSILHMIVRSFVALVGSLVIAAAYAREFRTPTTCAEVADKQQDFRQQMTDLKAQYRIADARNAVKGWTAQVELVCGQSSRFYANALRDWADLEDLANNALGARDLNNQALNIRERLGTIDPVTLSINRWKLANSEIKLGRFSVAEPLLKRVQQELVSSPIYGTPIYAMVLQDVAQLYAWEGEFGEAEKALGEARAIVSSVQDDATSARFESIAAKIYRDMGMLNLAEHYLSQMQSKLESTPKLNNQQAILKALNGSALARVQVRLGYPEKAVATASEALSVLLELPVSMRYWSVGSRLALMEAEATRGQANRALEHAQAAVDLVDTPLVEAEFRYVQAHIFSELKRFPEALESIEKAISIVRGSSMLPSPRLLRNLDAKAMILWAKGDQLLAHKAFAEATEGFERLLRRTLFVLPEVRRRALLDSARNMVDDLVSFHFDVKDSRPESIDLALDNVLRWKGRQLETAAGLRSIARIGAAESLLDNVAALDLLNAQIATERFSSAVGGSAAISARQGELLARQEEIERSLQASLLPTIASRRGVSGVSVAANLPEGGALVEFFRFRANRPAGRGIDGASVNEHYAVFVITADGKRYSADIGEASEIDELIRRWLGAIVAMDGAQVVSLGEKLDSVVLRPLLAWIPDRKKIIVSGDSSIGSIPFAALIGPNGSYRVEEGYVFSYLATGSALLRPTNVAYSKEAAVVLGGPAYAKVPEELLLPRFMDMLMAESLLVDGDRSFTQGGNNVAAHAPLRFPYFDELPGAAAEASSVAALLKVLPLVGADANKLNFLSSIKQSPWILHLATHAYVLSDDTLRPYPQTKRQQVLFTDGDYPAVVSPSIDAMLRSGIALAGANDLRATNLGLVTALELAGTNLSGTELVVLSACKTSAGEVFAGEGVVGLRRALEISGAHAGLTTLWSISDRSTQRFMDLFYPKVLQPGADKAGSVARAQLEMLADPATSMPVYWAPFILSGRPGPLWRPIMAPAIKMH